MSGKAIDVQHWPACGENVRPVDGLIVVAVDTPPTPIRATARKLVRDAARKILGNLLACPPTSVNVFSQPGQAPRVAGHDDIHLSISHEPGLSLLAINLRGAVGVDLLRIAETPDWQAEIPTLARDYLGPAIAQSLRGCASAEQAMRFAEHWVRHEASLKCLGIGLMEWYSGMAEQLACCQVSRLILPARLTGAVATKADGTPAA